jgi:EpsI family protein
LVYALAVLRTSHQAVAAEVSTGTAPGWNGSLASPKSTEWRPVFIGTHSERHMVYVDGGGERIEAFQIGYPSQEQGRELVNEGNSLLGNGGLQASGDHVVRTATGTYNEIVATDSQGNQSVVWSDYEIGGKPFVTPVLSQLWYGLRALADPPYSALLAYRSACKPSCDAARDRLKRLLEPSGALFTGQNQVRPERDSGTQHGRRYESGAQGLESTS